MVIFPAALCMLLKLLDKLQVSWSHYGAVSSSFSLGDFTLLQYGDKLSATLTANNDTAFRFTESPKEFCATVA